MKSCWVAEKLVFHFELKIGLLVVPLVQVMLVGVSPLLAGSIQTKRCICPFMTNLVGLAVVSPFVTQLFRASIIAFSGQAADLFFFG